jgi:hypothetical protein
MTDAPTLNTETRFFRAMVRRHRDQGAHFVKIFACTVPVTGSYHLMCDAAINDMVQQGWEVLYLMSNSTKRDCL